MNLQTRVKVTSATVTAVQPERADVRRLDYLRTTSNAAVESYYHIVKLYLQDPLPEAADAMQLFVGEEDIPKYNGFIGGLYFKVYDPGFFERHTGDTIYVSLDGATRVDTGAVLPQRPAGRAGRAAPTLPSARAAAPASRFDEQAESTLPTKSDVLRQ